MNALRLLLPLVFIWATSLFSVANEPSPTCPPEERVQSLPQCPAPVETQDLVIKERIAFREQIRSLFNQRQFGQLEQIAQTLRQSKACLGNGSWKIYQFYNCLECSKKDTESTWQLYEQIHKAWLTAYPSSITAKTAYANYYERYAWYARGGGFARTVTDEGWKLFEERLKTAAKIWADGEKLMQHCPYWYQLGIDIGVGQEWEREKIFSLFKEAKKFEPGYFGYDISLARYLQPRWYGNEGEWETVAEAAAKEPNGLGWAGYARVVWAQSEYVSNIFKETHASWPETKQGFQLLRQHYPDSLEILNGFCSLACEAKDRACAKELFQEINGRMNLPIWQSKERFIKNQNWAYSDD